MSSPNQLFSPTTFVEKDLQLQHWYIKSGPRHSDLDDFIASDPTEYTGKPLIDETLRRMIASAAFGVLELSGQYDRIVGEDTSGRYPAIIIGEAVNQIRENVGTEPAKRSFLSGRLTDEGEPDWQYTVDEKMLVVTEVVSTGGSSGRIVKALGEKLIDMPDFLIIDGAPWNCGGPQKEALIKGGGRLFTGDLSDKSFYADLHLCYGPADIWKGVVKSDGYTHADAAPYGEGGTYTYNAERSAVVASRREAKAFGQHIANYYLQNK